MRTDVETGIGQGFGCFFRGLVGQVCQEQVLAAPRAAGNGSGPMNPAPTTTITSFYINAPICQGLGQSSEDVARHADSIDGTRPAGAERQVGDGLDETQRSSTPLSRPSHVTAQLVRTVHRDEHSP